MDKRICLKCKKKKLFSRALENSLICLSCLPSEKNMIRANEIISQHFSELGKKSWTARKNKIIEEVSRKTK